MNSNTNSDIYNFFFLALIVLVVIGFFFKNKKLPGIFGKPIIREEKNGETITLTPVEKKKRFILYGVLVAVWVLGIIGLILGFKFYPPLEGSMQDRLRLVVEPLKLAVPLCCLFMVPAIRINRRTWRHAPAKYLLLIVVSFFAFQVFVIGIGLFLNGNLDKAPVKVHYLPVIDKFINESTDGRRVACIIEYETWRDRGGSERLKVSRDQYEKVVPGKTLIKFAVKPGALGFAWKQEVEIFTGQ